MNDFLKKLIPEEKEITKEEARLITLTGNMYPTEVRVSKFIKETNKVIANRAKLEKSYLLVEIPKDLIGERSTIIDSFKSRGFNIKEFQPIEENLFFISWLQ